MTKLFTLHSRGERWRNFTDSPNVVGVFVVFIFMDQRHDVMPSCQSASLNLDILTMWCDQLVTSVLATF